MKTLVFFTNIRWMLMNKRTMSDWCLSFPKSGYSKLPLILSLASCLFWSFRMAWAFLLLMWSRWNNGTLAWGRRSSVMSVTWVSSCDSRSEKRTIIRCNGITEIHVINSPGLFALSRRLYVNHKTIKTIDLRPQWTGMLQVDYSHFVVIYPQERLVSSCTGLTAYTLRMLLPSLLEYCL